METKVFKRDNCTVIVHIGKNSQKVVEKATEKFLKAIMKER